MQSISFQPSNGSYLEEYIPLLSIGAMYVEILIDILMDCIVTGIVVIRSQHQKGSIRTGSPALVQSEPVL